MNRDPNSNQENKWHRYNKTNPNILRINSNKFKNNSLDLIKKWLKRHEFWYEQLPNQIFNHCFYIANDKKKKFDADFIENYFKADHVSMNKIEKPNGNNNLNTFLADVKKMNPFNPTTYSCSTSFVSSKLLFSLVAIFTLQL